MNMLTQWAELAKVENMRMLENCDLPVTNVQVTPPRIVKRRETVRRLRAEGMGPTMIARTLKASMGAIENDIRHIEMQDSYITQGVFLPKPEDAA